LGGVTIRIELPGDGELLAVRLASNEGSPYRSTTPNNTNAAVNKPYNACPVEIHSHISIARTVNIPNHHQKFSGIVIVEKLIGPILIPSD
jgi:hypothetical protein